MERIQVVGIIHDSLIVMNIVSVGVLCLDVLISRQEITEG